MHTTSLLRVSPMCLSHLCLKTVGSLKGRYLSGNFQELVDISHVLDSVMGRREVIFLQSERFEHAFGIQTLDKSVIYDDIPFFVFAHCLSTADILKAHSQDEITRYQIGIVKDGHPHWANALAPEHLVRLPDIRYISALSCELDVGHANFRQFTAICFIRKMRPEPADIIDDFRHNYELGWGRAAQLPGGGRFRQQFVVAANLPPFRDISDT